jgi:mannose-1-phosphate guanylyltransferase
MRAVVLAGGGGTRLRPLTNVTPKPMVEFMGQPYAVGLLRRLAATGVDRLDLLVGRRTDDFAALVTAGRSIGVAVSVLTEDEPLDTAGAARRLLRGSGETDVLVCNGDVLTDLDYADLLARHRRSDAVVTLALTRVGDTSSFGVIECDPDGVVRRFVEKPPPGTTTADTINAGTYVLDSAAFDPFPGDGPLSFERQVFPGLLAAGATLRGVPSAAHWQDLGTPARFRDGHRAVLERRCAWPAAEGLEHTEGAVAVHRSAVLGDGVKLEEPVTIGADVHVGAGAHMHDTVVLRGARIGEGAVLRSAIVGPGAVVPADAQIGPDQIVVADGEAPTATGPVTP